jgi:hypothetical protein
MSKFDNRPLPDVDVAVVCKNTGVLTDAHGHLGVETTHKDEWSVT